MDSRRKTTNGKLGTKLPHHRASPTIARSRFRPRDASPSSSEPHGANGMASSPDSSADESGYVEARPPYPRAAFMTGPEPMRTVDLTLLDPHDTLSCTRKAEVNESLGWLTARGNDMKARLDYHTELMTDMSGQMHEMEQDIMLNHDKTIAAMKEARAAKFQSRVTIAVALA
ncbi:hypothetical protein L1987_15028 [Smallanthus sonchifolius]|uniref:Uncharacterized protein n=1 Tax=Smallanthus sonchifolius TaxID=185202 RepID=A0ACB9J4U0_9ASTR|nr:hypothetical protein L1987_15028 [Smallanthus sonchifolius]